MLVVTEGLLIYLSDEDVGALASDLHESPTFARWIIDLANPAAAQDDDEVVGQDGRGRKCAVQICAGKRYELLPGFGWEERDFHSTMEEAERLDRE